MTRAAARSAAMKSQSRTPKRRSPPVLILCGGQGTRIRGVADDVPKPMMEIGGLPILWHIMKGYAAHGFRDFVLLLGYRGEVIRRFFLNYRAMMCDVTLSLGGTGRIEYRSRHQEEDWRVTLVHTGAEAMTGARVWRGAQRIGPGTFLATYGDGVSDIDLRALLRFHRTHGKLATVTGVHPPGRFGELRTRGGRVVEFREKPQLAEGAINGGFFVFERAFVEKYLADDDRLVLERDPLMRCAADGELMMFRHGGFWQPMDTYREWVILNDLWKSGKAPWKSWR